MDKLILEHDKKKLQLRELLEKRKDMVGKIKALWDKIGQKKGFNLDLDIGAIPEQNENIEDVNNKVSLELDPENYF